MAARYSNSSKSANIKDLGGAFIKVWGIFTQKINNLYMMTIEEMVIAGAIRAFYNHSVRLYPLPFGKQ